jgi:hypothetical protein
MTQQLDLTNLKANLAAAFVECGLGDRLALFQQETLQLPPGIAAGFIGAVQRLAVESGYLSIEPDTVVPGLCCVGHDWRVALILDSVWGVCSNPDCATGLERGAEDYYRGVSHHSVEDIAGKLLEVLGK